MKSEVMIENNYFPLQVTQKDDLLLFLIVSLVRKLTLKGD